MTSRADERAAAIQVRLGEALSVRQPWAVVADDYDRSLARFLAHAPADLAWLLAEREQLTQALRALTDEGFKHRTDVWCGDYERALQNAQKALAGADGDA